MRPQPTTAVPPAAETEAGVQAARAMAGSRLYALDGLRGLAALLVVTFHYTTRFGIVYGHPGGLPIGLPHGHYGVQLFFIISGFVIFMTLERTRNFMDFLVSRFARLFPAYWCAVLVTAAVVWAVGLPGRKLPPATVLVNLTMLQQWLRIPHVDTVYWTLTIELAFYAIMFALLCVRLLPRIRLVAAAWLVVMVAVHWFEVARGREISDLIHVGLLLDYANLFMTGVMFYKLHMARVATQAGGAPVDTRGTGPLIVAALVVEYVIHGWVSGLIVTALFALFSAAVFNIGGAARLLAWRPLVFVGTVSYSLYLLHQNIGYATLRELYALGWPPVAALPATFALNLVLATLFFKLVETPGRELIRNGYKRLSAERKPQTAEKPAPRSEA